MYVHKNKTFWHNKVKLVFMWVYLALLFSLFYQWFVYVLDISSLATYLIEYEGTPNTPYTDIPYTIHEYK